MVVERLRVELVGEDAGAVQALDLLLLGRQGAQVRLDDVDDDQVGGRDGAQSGEELNQLHSIFCEVKRLE